MNTKKLLVAYDEAKPTAGQGDFLTIVFEGPNPVFFGLRSRRICKSGRIIFLGKEITEKDIFAKLVDSGRKIESVDKTLKSIVGYIQQLNNFKIGSVVAAVANESDDGFKLVNATDLPKL